MAWIYRSECCFWFLILLTFAHIEQSFAFVPSAKPRIYVICRYRGDIDADVDADQMFEATDAEDDIQPLLKLASTECASQVLTLTSNLGLVDIFDSQSKTLQEISKKLDVFERKDDLLAAMQLLTAVGMLQEEEYQDTVAYSLTETGNFLLRNIHVHNTLKSDCWTTS